MNTKYSLAGVMRVTQTHGIILFLVAWIIPTTYYGITDAAPFWLPGEVSRWSDVARLFSREQKTWAVYEIQVLFTDSDTYERLPEADFFGKMPFGYRSRLQRILDLSDHKTMEALAIWTHERMTQKVGRQATKIRFVAFEYVTEKDWVTGRRYYQPEDLGTLGEFTVLSEFSLNELAK